MKTYISSIIFLLIVHFATNAQGVESLQVNFKEFRNGEDKEAFKTAKKNVKLGDELLLIATPGAFLKALAFYNQAYKYNPNNAELNIKIAYCYLKTLYKKNSLEFLEKAYQIKPELSYLIHYYLGESYQYNSKFDDAIKHYTVFKSKVHKSYIEQIDKRISECNYGKQYLQNIQNVVIRNLENVNSEYPDYSPLISADEEVLFFTSRRKGSTAGKISAQDDLFYEDIYCAKKENTHFSSPKNAGISLNSDEHDATVGLSPDGQRIFIYRKQDIYYSELKGEDWSVPAKLPKTINTHNHVENSACFSPDGRTIYFIRGKTSDPETTNGDIFFSNYVMGQWTEAEKLPSNINSKYDEDGVFMHPDGKTLFFSSKGHTSMGGYDIFKTTKTGKGRWSDPVNMGSPINSPDDDIYFVLSANGRTGYYSSVKNEGKGATDIYQLIFIKLDKPLVLSTEDELLSSADAPVIEMSTKEIEEFDALFLTIVKGTISDGNTDEKLEATISITDNATGEVIMDFNSNATTGKYLISLPSGKNYAMTVEAPNYIFHSENFDIPEAEKYQEIIKDIKLYNFEKGSKVVLRNVFFDTDKYEIRPESNVEMDRIVKIMQQKSDLRIEISGHTDNEGTYKHNITLSENRAKAVMNYIIGKGIDGKRLEYKGKSWDEPISTNKTEEGRQLNRRVEFKII